MNFDDGREGRYTMQFLLESSMYFFDMSNKFELTGSVNEISLSLKQDENRIYCRCGSTTIEV